MKKLISLLLILCVACMLVPATADADVTGEWYASYMGVVMTMNLNADGTGTMAIPGQEQPEAASWTMEGDQITITVQDSPATGTVTADSIQMTQDGMELVFTREPVAPIQVAAVKAAASEDEFLGDWTCAYVEAQGMIVDMSSLGGMVMSDITVKDGAIEFIAANEEDFMATMYNMMGLTYKFEDGKLVLASSVQDAGISGVIETLEDGMIKMTMDTGTEDPMIVYFAKKAAAEEPAA